MSHSSTSEEEDYDPDESDKQKNDRVRALFEEEGSSVVSFPSCGIEDRFLILPSLSTPSGQLSRLVRAVKECDFGPKEKDWENYIIEFANQAEEVYESKVGKKVEQINLANNPVRMWDSIAAASRGCCIPLHYITNCLAGKTDEAGGFKWRYV